MIQKPNPLVTKGKRKERYSRHDGDCLAVAVGFAVVTAILLIPGCAKLVVGAAPFGPKDVLRNVTIERLYVDNSGDSSHYMIGTDKGVFECDNSLILGIWDADERYAALKEGGTYHFEVKGRKVLNLIFQEYPLLLEARAASPTN